MVSADKSHIITENLYNTRQVHANIPSHLDKPDLTGNDSMEQSLEFMLCHYFNRC